MKNSIVALAIVLLLAGFMVTAGPSVLLAKEDSGSSGGGDSGGSSDNGGGNKDNGDHPNDSGSGSSDNNGGDKKTEDPGHACAGGCGGFDEGSNNNDNKQDIQSPIVPSDGSKQPKSTDTIDFGCHFHPNDDRCKPDVPGQCPGGFASNDKGNCHPIGPCPPGFGRHDNDESGQCFRNPDFCHFHDCGHHTSVKVIHQTKVVHKKDVVGIATVFVPGIGLVEPFNCKLNENNGKIGCEFVVVKVID